MTEEMAPEYRGDPRRLANASTPAGTNLHGIVNELEQHVGQISDTAARLEGKADMLAGTVMAEAVPSQPDSPHPPTLYAQIQECSRRLTVAHATLLSIEERL